MELRSVVSLAGAVVLAVCVGSAAAQEVTAEVLTWDGRSWRLTDPSLEVFYTITPPSRQTDGESPAAPSPSPRASLFGAPPSPMAGLLQSSSPATQSEPKQGHTRTEGVTLSRAGVEVRVPLARMASLVFSRQPVRQPLLPPHVAATHFRYAATAILLDGSRVEGDYVNLGTALLRGTTPQGRVDIPWQAIERVSFERVQARKTAADLAPPSPVSQAPVSPPPAVKEAISRLEDVFFDFDRYELRDDARATLDGNVKWLKARPETRVVVEGHCDERGTNEYNLALGERRAEAVRDYLVGAGVEASRLSTISYGEERPFVPGRGESAWKWNRRAHLVVTR